MIDRRGRMERHIRPRPQAARLGQQEYREDRGTENDPRP
jgi:hypothetical protein